MPAAYSYHLRERVVDAVERGSSRRRAATVFKVSAATVVRWTKRMAETGSFAAAPMGRRFQIKGRRGSQGLVVGHGAGGAGSDVGQA